MKVNKKAAIILLSASIAFFIASVMFLNTEIKLPTVLGENQMKLLNLQKEEVKYLIFIEDAAKLALAETIKMFPSTQQDFYELCRSKNRACEELPTYFKNSFQKYINSFNKAYNQNLKLDNYEFKSKIIELEKKTAIELTGVSTSKVYMKKGEDILYIVKPNFKLRVSLDELNELATTPKTMAISFFNDVVKKFQMCSKIDKEISCICDDSLITPAELPEGYHIKISTTAGRELLDRVAEYKFELLYKNDVVDVEGKKMVRNLRGRFGAHEFFNEDLNNKLCFPGIIPKSRIYFIEREFEKGWLFFFFGDANCAGISKFSMIEFVKESQLSEVKGPYCSKIGIKD